MPQLPKGVDVIFDLGGYPDERAITALKQSVCVIVPVILDQGDLQITLNFINEIQDYNQNIIIVANRTSKGDYDQIKMIMNKFFPKYPVFEIKETRAMPNILTEKKSIKKMTEESGIKKYHFQFVVNQFEKLISYIYDNFK